MTKRTHSSGTVRESHPFPFSRAPRRSGPGAAHRNRPQSYSFLQKIPPSRPGIFLLHAKSPRHNSVPMPSPAAGKRQTQRNSAPPSVRPGNGRGETGKRKARRRSLSKWPQFSHQAFPKNNPYFRFFYPYFRFFCPYFSFSNPYFRKKPCFYSNFKHFLKYPYILLHLHY